MFLVLVFFLAMEITGSGPPNQETVSRPNVENFNIVLSKELEFRIDDYKTALVGRMFVYQNPNDENEFVRVYYRQLALVSERAQEKNAVEAGSRDANLSNLKYHSQQEAEALGRVQQATDAFVYVQWRTVRDVRTGQDIQAGPMQIWLLNPSGAWVYHTQPPGEKSALETSPFSEPSKTDSKKIISVGIKFTLGDSAHIVRIDQDDIFVSGKEAANDKK